jgi:hypothetical protein
MNDLTACMHGDWSSIFGETPGWCWVINSAQNLWMEQLAAYGNHGPILTLAE